MDERTGKFLDVMEKINVAAKSQGHINGVDWAKKAAESGVISREDAAEFGNAHHLRNSLCHGSARDIGISEETLAFAMKIYGIILQVSQKTDGPTATKPRTSFHQKLFNKEGSAPAEKPAAPAPKQGSESGSLERYFQNAKMGDVSAQCELGRRYAIGEGVAEDQAESLKWYRLAAQLGHAEAQFILGTWHDKNYDEHIGVSKDREKAKEWYLQAAEQGHAKAQFQLAELLYHSGSSGYRGEAVAWYRKAAEQGLPEAQCAAGIFDPANRFNWLKKASEQGYALASRRIGDDYLSDARHSGVSSVSHYKARTWYLKAVEQGDSYSTVKVGVSFFLQGDKSEALKWYLKSVELGETDAIPAIAMIYEELGNAEEAIKWYLKRDEGKYDSYKLGCLYEKCGDDAEAVKWYRKAAERGNEKAQLALAEHYKKEDRYLHVDDAEKEEAQKWFLKAAELGNTDVIGAMCFLCAQYKMGDWDEVHKWSLKAAEQGNADAQYGLGLLYRDRDPKEEVKWLLLAAKQGHEGAQTWMGLKKTGVDVPEDPEMEAVYLAQAEKGDSQEMYCMGRYYLDGINGVPKNLTKAVEWLTKAAEQGHADAQYALGSYYETEDHKEAEKWYRKAAEQGHTRAQIDLSQLYCEGDMYDEAESVKWLKKAAKQGDRTALGLLADCETDEDALDDDDTLEERYIAEAKTGDPVAMYELGYNYLYGCGGVPKNLEKAVAWLTAAAERGNGEAMYELGCCYENGWGVDQDEDEARQWYWEAFVLGSDEAEERLDALREEEDEED